MRKTFLLSLVGFTMFALASCQKESNEVGPDNSIANESVSTSALSAVTGKMVLSVSFIPNQVTLRHCLRNGKMVICPCSSLSD